MNLSWREILQNSVRTVEALSGYFPDVAGDLHRVTAQYPMKINPYYLSLMETSDGPLARQVIPSPDELGGLHACPDPLAEEGLSPVKGVIHRYPDRVIFLASSECAVYCRFCMRKRNVGRSAAFPCKWLDDAAAYVRSDQRIKEVILSGGDPLLLGDDRVEHLLNEFRRIPHVRMIRIHSRVICTLPQRITRRLAEMLAKYHPMCLNTHFNHPAEITPCAEKSIKLLAEQRVMLGSQTVLLNGVNNEPLILERLFRKLVCLGVRPYYLHHPDLVKGTGHFYCSLEQGVSLMKSLRGFISGMCIPHYVVDLPGGGGKVPVTPDRVKAKDKEGYVFENHNGSLIRYPCL